MGSFVVGLLGAVVGVALLAALVFWWIRRKIKRFAQALGAMAGGGVPPFRITLEPDPDVEWNEAQAVAALTGALTDAGYVSAGDFLVPEMTGVKLRGFVNAGAGTLAAVFEHPQASQPLFLDIARPHRDRVQVLVTTTPDDGLEQPPAKRTVRFCADIIDADAARAAVGAMHERVLSESAGHEPLVLAPRHFASAFTAAYAAEMDWRIARGGVTDAEVVAAAQAGGQDAPDEGGIEMVCGMWRSAIDEFVSEEVRRAFLAAGTVSAVDWERMRDRVLVVHERSDVETLAEEVIGDVVDLDTEDEDGSRLARLEQEIRAAIRGVDAIQAFESARAKVEALSAYELVGGVERPWRGSVYLRPVPVEA